MNPIYQMLQQLTNQPLLLDANYAQGFIDHQLSPLLRNDVRPVIKADSELLEFDAFYGIAQRDKRPRTYRVQDGVAILPVIGALRNDISYIYPDRWYGTSYKGIIARAQQAAEDPEVKGILLDQNSPGGAVSGCFDTVKTLRKIAAESNKPLWSLCSDMTCSASMAIASAASRRLITSTGQAGSVGVIMAHRNQEKLLKDIGLDITLITAGKHKADGNPYEKLPADVLANFQKEADDIRNEFAELVEQGTRMTLAQVLATEAQTYRGQEAIDIGFADQLVNGFEAVATFAEFLKTSTKTTVSGVTMSEAEKPAAAAAEEKKPAATAAAPAAPAAADTATIDAGAERTRIKGIMQSEHAKGRETLAEHFAYDTDMTVEAATAALEKAPLASAGESDPKPAAEAPADPLEQAMANAETPNIGADAEQQESEMSADDEVDSFLAAHQKATGVQHN